MKKFIVILLSCFVTISSFAQSKPHKEIALYTVPGKYISNETHTDYGNWLILGAEYRYFDEKNHILSFNLDWEFDRGWGYGPHLTLNYGWSFPICNSGLRFYVAPGLFNSLRICPFEVNPYTDDAFGIQAEIGFDYAFNKVPIALFVDWTPDVGYSVYSQASFYGYKTFRLGIGYCF